MSLVVDLGRALAQIGDPRFRAVLWKALGLTIDHSASPSWDEGHMTAAVFDFDNDG